MVGSLFLPHGMGLSKAIRNAERIATNCPHDFSLRSRNTVSCTLSRLKRKRLVNTRGPKKKTVWLITTRGRNHFQKIIAAASRTLPPDDGKMRLVVFDVPEEERKKRDWLRKRLLSCEYEPLQKSVWVGTRPLPAELMEELKDNHLTSYVYIIGLEKGPRLGRQ